MTKIRVTVLVLVVGVMALASAGPATAKDRNNDRIPDRWEKKHGLSLKKKQGRRDQDRDGLKNRAEFRTKSDPRSSDSDGDGIEDGDEGAGRVASFNSETGELVINLFGSSTVSGLVTPDTEIRCGCKGTDDDYEDGNDATLMHGGDDDDLSGSDDDDGDEDHDGDDQGEDDDGHDDDRECSTDELVEGTPVSEAELELNSAGLVFEEIELVKRNPNRKGNR